MPIKTLFLVLLMAVATLAGAQGEPVGIVVMHGKGGSPNARHIVEFVQRLESRGFRVANLEMPWSGARNYDVPVARGEEEVTAAVADLRSKGAKKVFIAGHSQGGGFVLHYAGRHGADGIIALAPGGNVGSLMFERYVGNARTRARKLVAEGKGDEVTELRDYEGKRGDYPVFSPPAAWLTWFEPEGAMNIPRAAKAVDPKTPVLFVIPTDDYPTLLKSSPGVYRSLPKNPLTKLYEPRADHLGAPAASVDEIVRWTKEVVGGKP